VSTETIDRLASIIDGLAPLGDAGPGQPVLAAEWNALVGAVQELARIAVAREQSAEEVLAANFARLGHGHDGAVNLTWFDPETRSLVEGARSQRADLAAELARTQRTQAELRTALDEVRADLASVKDQLDDIGDRDRHRSRSVDKLSARVEDFVGNATSIADLRTTLGAMDSRVGEALAFRDELVDDAGDRVDLAALRGDVSELLKIRENLTAADGRVVEYRDFERRLVAIEDTVGEDGGERPGGNLPGFDLDSFRAEVLDAATARLDPRLLAVEAGVTNAGSRLDGIDPRVTSAQEALAGHTAQIGALQTATAGLPDLSTRVATAETRLSAHDTQLTVVAPLSDRVSTAESALASLPSLEARLATNEAELASTRESVTRIDQMDSRLSAIEALDLPPILDRVGVLEAGLSETRSVATENGERVTVLESRADDSDRRFLDVETLGNANREVIDLLSRDVQDIRTTTPSRPLGGPTIGRLVTERPGGGVVPG
jgi:predicted  nucleic acid-binding Zn-ribbon protein